MLGVDRYRTNAQNTHTHRDFKILYVGILAHTYVFNDNPHLPVKKNQFGKSVLAFIYEQIHHSRVFRKNKFKC